MKKWKFMASYYALKNKTTTILIGYQYYHCISYTFPLLVDFIIFVSIESKYFEEKLKWIKKLNKNLKK